MSHAPVTAIIFDYGKVLSVPPTDQQWQRLASVFSIDEHTFQHQYWQFRDGYDRGELNGATYWRKVAEVNHQTLTDQQVEQLVAFDNDQWTNENPDMLDLAWRAQAAGKRIAILSNMQPEMLAFMRKKFKWLSRFDVQMYSCEEGIVKPEKKIYLDCCDRLKVEPASALFLDDKDPNVQGALRAGLQAILFAGDHKAVQNYLDNGR